MRSGLSVMLLAALIAAGCGATSVAKMASLTDAVTTDRSEYQLRNGTADVLVTYRNDVDSVRYLGRCGDAASTLVERLEGGRWTPLELGFCPAVLGPPVTVAPGASHSVKVTLLPGPLVDAAKLIGTFRIRFVVYSRIDERGYATGTPLDAAKSTSPAFSVRE